ncbi:hypothetical protein [Bacillus thuringiensis]|uniref:hypothetical protein n=1 Tax=Bacillus thuringiensis TaxID=1428 RepID=UPI0037D2851B
MLIIIDDTVAEYIRSNKEKLNWDSIETKALNNIAKALQEGYHIISVSSYDVLETLAKLDCLEWNARRTYETLSQKFTFYLSYEDFCCSYILVKSNSFDFYRNDKEPNKIIYEVPLSRFSSFDLLFPTRLLSEDASDCDFYEKIAEKYISENKDEINVKLKFDQISGGGSQSYVNYEREINKGSKILAICDNDKSYLEDKEGETFRQLQKIYDKNKKESIIEFHGLKVREKENLIPPSMYRMCCNNSGNDVLNKLEEIERLDEHQSKLMFIDIKEGIEAKVAKDEKFKEYYRELFEVVDLISCSLEEVDEKGDKDILMMGIGRKFDAFINDVFEGGLEEALEGKKKIAQKVGIPVDVIKKMEEDILKKQNLINNLPDYLKDEWRELCHKLISWGCCEYPPA